MLLEAGIQITHVLDTCTSTIANKKIAITFTRAAKKLLQGQPFSKAIEATELFPETSIETLAVGEKTGDLES